MPRSTEEWVGKTDDTAIPPRVRLRVFLKFDGICQECGVKIIGKRWICDHRAALINGGENRENNLGPIHEACDKTKTAQDVAEKSKTYQKRLARLGLKKTKGRPLPGTRASGWRHRMNGRWERR
jgi:5-methylcytosine-specific restriction endonuclease McrA